MFRTVLAAATLAISMNAQAQSIPEPLAGALNAVPGVGTGTVSDITTAISTQAIGPAGAALAAALPIPGADSAIPAVVAVAQDVTVIVGNVGDYVLRKGAAIRANPAAINPAPEVALLDDVVLQTGDLLQLRLNGLAMAAGGQTFPLPVTAATQPLASGIAAITTPIASALGGLGGPAAPVSGGTSGPSSPLGGLGGLGAALQPILAPLTSLGR